MSVVPENQNDIQDRRSITRSNFKQQNIKAYKPVPTVKSAAIIFTALGIIFIIVGAVLLYKSLEIIEYRITNYDLTANCKDTISSNPTPNTCTGIFNVDKDMEPPVYFYYQLDNFYQNHRRYVKSKSSSQLAGNNINENEAKTDCDPIVSMTDLGFNVDTLNKLSSLYKLNKTWTNDLIKSTTVANPCGHIAQTFFNDTYTMTASNGSKVIIDETSIAWQSDKDYKFKKAPSEATPWIDVTNEHFIVWMRTSGLPNFRKLWGRITQGLPKGEYTVTINSNYPVDQFSGHKSVIISTANALGGNNMFLGIAYIVVGGITLILALAFVIRGYCFRKADDLHRN